MTTPWLHSTSTGRLISSSVALAFSFHCAALPVHFRVMCQICTAGSLLEFSVHKSLVPVPLSVATHIQSGFTSMQLFGGGSRSYFTLAHFSLLFFCSVFNFEWHMLKHNAKHLSLNSQPPLKENSCFVRSEAFPHNKLIRY